MTRHLSPAAVDVPLDGTTAPREGDYRALPPVATTCPHHWDVETPNGAHVTGVCRKCGEQRVYWTAGPPDLNKARAYAAPHYEPPTMARYM